MSDGSELYELFLALAPSRLDAARRALEQGEPVVVTRELEAALVPLAVDATLLGADGLAALALAICRARSTSGSQRDEALDALQAATEALGHHDESGARVNESELIARAEALAGPKEEPAAAPERSAAAEGGDDSVWEPSLAEDMIAAFLDECVDRLEGLAERLLVLEERQDDVALIGEIFRDLHTLKGSSAFAGLRRMNRVAHLAEDLIGQLRDGKRAVDRAVIDVLLETLDVLRVIVDKARARERIDVSVDGLLERLRDPGGRPAPAAPADPAERPAATKPEAGTTAVAAKASATLRIEFEKVDQLLNLVGEIVLARGRIGAVHEVNAAVIRELSTLRKKLGQRGDGSADGRPAASLLDELVRTERVLAESHADLDSGLGSLSLAVSQLRDTVMKLRMVPIARLFTKYQRTVRELANKLGKRVTVELVGADTELDKVLVERLEDPLLHLVRNSVDHGIELPEARRAAGKPEAGTVRLIASQRGGQIVVAIEDDGRGMDPTALATKAVEKGIIGEEEARALSPRECFELIFRAGFSTAAEVSDVSGRGVGMDVVRDTIEKLKGSIAIDSSAGRGSRMELRLPLTLAITQVLAARVGGELLAIPLDAVVSAQAASAVALETVADGRCVRVADQLVPVVDLAAVLGVSAEGTLGDGAEEAIVLVDVGTERLGLLVSQLLGRHEVVIKSLGPLLARAPCAAGATLIGDRIVLVVDLGQVAQRASSKVAPVRPRRLEAASARGVKILVAEDSDVIREAVRRELSLAGFEVVTAVDGQEALERAERERFDAVCTDVMMPRLDGYGLVRELRRLPAFASVPIVMLTSKDARIDAMRGADAGADAYLTKPAEGRALVRTLEELLAQRKTA